MSVFIKILGFILPSIVGGLIGYLASLAKQKRDAKERFFYEVYPKRLELYRKTFRLFRDFKLKVNDSEKQNQKEYALRILGDFSNSLIQFQSEAFLFCGREFNIAVEQTLKNALVFQKEVLSDTFRNGEGAALLVLFGSLTPYMQSLEEIIERETPADFIDKHIKELAKKKADKTKAKT